MTPRDAVLLLALVGFVAYWGLWSLAIWPRWPARAWRWFKGTKHPWVWRRVLARPGDPAYMIRYQLCVTRWLVVYINVILLPDADKRLHTHPWKRAYSLKLKGGYWERIPAEHASRCDGELAIAWDGITCGLMHRPKRWSRIPEKHRIVQLIDDKPATTLFIALGNPKPWGFVNEDGSVTDGPSSNARKL